MKNLGEQLGRILSENKQSIALAESCTGGSIAAALTDIPGSSAYFGYGIVSYSNKAKVKILGVSEETLVRYGAVSCQTAMEMAEGVRRLSGADYGLSVTGIAGPGGGTEIKPVGLIYVGFSCAKSTVWSELRLNGTRQDIRKATVKSALWLAVEKITEEISGRGN